jgi:hypothetical protein
MVSTDILIKARIQVIEDQNLLAKLKKVKAPMAAVAMAQEKLARSSAALDSAMGKIPFSGYALSVMFLGQQLQAMFTNMARFGVKAFNDVMHSVEGTVTQSDMLNSSMTYLGFTIGQALEPVLAYLIPIIDKVADWIVQNPKLTAGIIAVGTALGTILGIGGAAKLAFDGLSGTFFALSGAFSSTSTALGAVSIGLGGILLVAGLLALAVAGVVLAWKGLVEGFSQLTSGVVDVFKGLLDGDFTLLLQGLINIVSGVVKICAVWVISFHSKILFLAQSIASSWLSTHNM